MQTVTATKARSMIYKLIDDASDSHEPIQITGKRSNAVLVSEDDWRAIQESLYLVSIPGMRESIRSGLATPVSKCAMMPDLKKRIDVSKLPKAETIAKHLPPIVLSQKRTTEGTLVESSGPVSVSELLILGGTGYLATQHRPNH